MLGYWTRACRIVSSICVHFGRSCLTALPCLTGLSRIEKVVILYYLYLLTWRMTWLDKTWMTRCDSSMSRLAYPGNTDGTCQTVENICADLWGIYHPFFCQLVPQNLNAALRRCSSRPLVLWVRTFLGKLPVVWRISVDLLLLKQKQSQVWGHPPLLLCTSSIPNLSSGSIKIVLSSRYSPLRSSTVIPPPIPDMEMIRSRIHPKWTWRAGSFWESCIDYTDPSVHRLGKDVMQICPRRNFHPERK